MATIIIGSARSDENGKYSGGKAGDQKQTSSTNDTKGEVSMQTMYKHSKGWLVFRPKAVSVATQNASEMKNACNNAHIGYDQGQRGVLWNYVIKNVIKSLAKVASDVEVDCSELIRTIIYIVTGKDIGNITTANEATALKKSGLFEEPFEYESQEKTPVYNGDVLVTKTKGHTAIVVSGNPRTSGSTTTTTTTNGTKYYPKYTGSSSSIVDTLAAVGEKDTSKAHRTKIAEANGMFGYTGSTTENTKLLKLLKNGKLIKA
jgi:hypothetical protein